MTEYGFRAAEKSYLFNLESIVLKENGADSEQSKSLNKRIFQGWNNVPKDIQAITNFKAPTVPNMVYSHETKDINLGSIVMFRQQNAEPLYVWLHFNPDIYNNTIAMAYNSIISLAILLLCLMPLAAWYMHSQFVRPTVKLADAIRQFDWQGSKPLQLPKQKYYELGIISDALELSVIQMKKAQQSELDFLRFASHELRTPIAISLNAFELEQAKGITLSPVLQRAKKANDQMKDISETLLWLANEDVFLSEPEPISFREVIDEIIKEYKQFYTFSQGINITVNTDDAKLTTQRTPLLGILTNLIRNSFQHGEKYIVITQLKNKVTISNFKKETNHRSFGLGLTLAKMLAEKLSWKLNFDENDNEFNVTLIIKPNNKHT